MLINSDFEQSAPLTVIYHLRRKTMNLNKLTENIEQWAKDRNLDIADPSKQTLKLGEEFGELCQGLVKSNFDQVIDSIGDMYVVLTILSMQLGVDLGYCAQVAYDEIADRKGKMINGVFVKEEDLKEVARPEVSL